MNMDGMQDDEFTKDLIEHMTKAIEPTSYAEMIVPDSIEPVYGWKALRITKDGRLASPQQTTIWPVKQRLEATCGSNRVTYAWTAVHGEPKPSPVEVSGMVQGGAVFSSASVVSVTASSTGGGSMMVTPAEKPKTQLPAGMSWSWEPQPHEIASNDCRCGIYVVNNVRSAGTYLSADCILAEVCLWGRVVPGSEGARGQYAYPRQLFAPDTLADVATMVAQLYGVPIGYRDHKTGKTLSQAQAMENLAAIKNLSKPGPFKQKGTPMTQPSQVKFTPSPPAPAPVPLTMTQLHSGEEGVSFTPQGGIIITPQTSSIENRQLTVNGRIIFSVCWAAIFFIWVLALTVSPLLLGAVLPFFAIQFVMLSKLVRWS